MYKDMETYLSFKDKTFGLFIYYKNKFNIPVFTYLDSSLFVNRFKPLSGFLKHKLSNQVYNLYNYLVSIHY